MSQKKWNAKALFGLLVLVLFLGSCPQKPSPPSVLVPDPYPVPADAVKVEVCVVDSVSGTVVTGTQLLVFDSSTGKQVTHPLSVTNGKVTAKVSPKKNYNFHLLGQKGKWAGSLIENYYVSETDGQNFTMLQFKHGQITRGVTPPPCL